MSREDVAVLALLVILIAVVLRKNVKAAASVLGLLSFTLEAKDAQRPAPVRPRQPRLREPSGETDRSQN